MVRQTITRRTIGTENIPGTLVIIKLLETGQLPEEMSQVKRTEAKLERGEGSRLRKHVLLIDDDISFTRLIKEMLEETGSYEVHPLHDSSQAEKQARLSKPDVVVADIIMAPRDGGEVLTAFQGDPDLAQIPFVIMSAFLNNRVFPDSPIDFGAHDILEKPMNLGEIQRLIEKIEEVIADREKKPLPG